MVVYADLVFICNFVVDALLLFFTAQICHARRDAWRILLASFAGAGISILYPLLLTTPLWQQWLFKAIVGLVMVLLAFNLKGWRKTVTAFIILLLQTFVLGGFATAALKSLKEFSFAALMILLFVYFVSLKFLIVRLTKIRRIGSLLYQAHIVLGEREIKLACFLDTGNRLMDTQTGRPVHIVRFAAVRRLCPHLSLPAILNQNLNSIDLKDAHFVRVDTVNGSRNMLVFYADRIFITGGEKKIILEHAPIGISFKDFTDTVSYDMLLNGEVLYAV